MNRFVPLILAALLLASSSSIAFDGNRKGVILGAGLGTGFLDATWELTLESLDLSDSDTYSYTPLQFSLLAGYAPTNQWMIYSSTRGSRILAKSDERYSGPNLLTFYTGIGSSYFISEQAPGMLLTGGVGASFWLQEDVQPWQGIGGHLGLGYEATRHLTVEAGVLFGSHTRESNADLTIRTQSVYLTVNVLGY